MTGLPISPSHYIQSKYIVALGLPKWGLLKLKDSELFLADIGLPKLAIDRIIRNVKYTPPFGDKFITGLLK